MKYEIYGTENLKKEQIDLLQKAIKFLFVFKIFLQDENTSIQLDGKLIMTPESADDSIDERTERIINQTYHFLASPINIKDELRLNQFIDLWKLIRYGNYQDIVDGLLIRKKELDLEKEANEIWIDDADIEYELDEPVKSSEPSPKTLKSANILLFSTLFNKAVKQNRSKRA
jgi:hypothetical protein